MGGILANTCGTCILSAGEGSPWNGHRYQLVRSRPGQFLGTNWWFGELNSGWECRIRTLYEPTETLIFCMVNPWHHVYAIELTFLLLRKATHFYHDSHGIPVNLHGLFPMKGQSSFAQRLRWPLGQPIGGITQLDVWRTRLVSATCWGAGTVLDERGSRWGFQAVLVIKMVILKGIW